ncbi:dermonecrotic toxin domain-containing protein [Pseudomonas sp. SDO524_S393]
MPITSTTSTLPHMPAPQAAGHANEGDNAKTPTQTKATLKPEWASEAYFQEPVKRNVRLDNLARSYTPIKSDNEITSEQVKAHIAEKFGITNIDPDHTYLVTIVFNHKNDKEPNKGVITQKISLTEAARLNVQDIHLPFFSGPDSRSEYLGGPPPIEIDKKSRHTDTASADGTYPTPENVTYNKWTHGIYIEPNPGAPNTYDASNYVPIDPEEFKKMVWDHTYKKPYDDYLNSYWTGKTRREYIDTATVTYLLGAHIQHHNKSLTEHDRQIAMRAAGVSPDKTYLSTTPEDLVRPYKSDPDLETKFLTFNGYASRMFYSRDKTTQRTLLYIPGQMPPLQGFDSVEAMHRWLGEQLKDPQKADALKIQFRPEDRVSVGPVAGSLGGVSLGVDKLIDLMTDRLNNRISEETQEELRFWKEGIVFDGEVIKGNPFEELQYRTEKAAKAASDQRFVLNSDHTKDNVISWLKMASYGLLLLAPLGMAFPPVGVAITVGSVALGATELGIGIDDKINNRPGATERIFSGAFNTGKPILFEGFGRAFTPISGAIKHASFKV